MAALQKIVIGTPPGGIDGDTVRAASVKTNANIDVINAQTALVSGTALTTPGALTNANVGQRLNINLSAPGVINMPSAVTCGADQVIYLRNVGAFPATLAPAMGTSDGVGVTVVAPGSSFTLDTDGATGWKVFAGQATGDTAIHGTLTTDGAATVGDWLLVHGASYLTGPVTAYAGAAVTGDLSATGLITAKANPNLLYNGSGEFGDIGWSGAAFGGLVDPVTARGSQFVNAAALAAPAADQSTIINVGPAIALTLTGGIDAHGVTSGVLSAKLTAYKADGTNLGTVCAITGTNGAAWAHTTASGTTPALTAYVQLSKGISGTVSVTSGGAGFKRMKVELGNVATLYSQEASIAAAANATQSATLTTSTFYTVGTTDTVGGFASGDVALRTAGFIAPFVSVIRNGLTLRLGTHFTLDPDAIHVRFVEALASYEEVEVRLAGIPITNSNTLTVVNPTIASGPLTFPDGTTQNTALRSNRNFFVDGAFDSWAIATSAALASGGYPAATVWAAGTGGVGAGYGAGTLGLLDVATRSDLQAVTDTGPKRAAIFGMQTANTSGTFAARTLPFMWQGMEKVQHFAGKSVTVSFKLWSGAGNVTIPGIRCTQYMGTGGSPSASVVLDKVVNWVVTPTPKWFSVRIDFPSTNGVTLGTSGNDGNFIGLYFPAGQTFSLGVMEAQCEISSPTSSSDINGNGGSPTPFEYRGESGEALRIARLYQTNGSVVMGGASVANVLLGATYPLPVPMRIVPSVALVRTYTQNAAATSTAPAVTGTYVFISAAAVASGQVQYNDTYTLDARP